MIGVKNMTKIVFPKNILRPIQQYLTNRENVLNKRKKDLKAEDPFADPDRLNDNAAVDAEAAEQFGHERVEAMKREVDKGLINVRKALTKIKVGNYGMCEGCGAMIDTDRLAIDPTARYCMKCQSKKIEA
jgi:DnaK suppressor protein